MEKLGLTEEPILVVTAERIGDILFCLPGIRLLKENFPRTPIDVLVFSKNSLELFQFNPDIRQAIAAKKPREIYKLAKKYSLVVNLTHEFEKFLVKLPCKLISISEPTRTSHRTQQVLDFIRSLLPREDSTFSNIRYPLYPQLHHHQMIKSLLQTHEINLKQHLLIGCHLGCHRIARRHWQFWSNNRHQHKKVWPLENYLALSEELYHRHPNLKLIITGSQKESFLAKPFQKMPWVINLIGKTSLLETAALMDFLSVYVTHDTGTLHIACSRDTPLIALFGPTDVEFTGPFPLSEKHIILEKTTISDINVKDVANALQKILP